MAEERNHGIIFIWRVGVKHTVCHDGSGHLVQHQHVDTPARVSLRITVNLRKMENILQHKNIDNTFEIEFGELKTIYQSGEIFGTFVTL